MAVVDRTLREELEQIGRQARKASAALRSCTRGVKDAALLEAARRLRAAGPELRAANAKDLAAGREKGLTKALLDRLELTPERIEANRLRAFLQWFDPLPPGLHAHIPGDSILREFIGGSLLEHYQPGVLL